MDNLGRLRLNNNQLTGEWSDKQWNENRTLVVLEAQDHSDRIFLNIEIEEGDEFDRERVREVAVVDERSHARMYFNDVSILAVNLDITQVNLDIIEDQPPREPGQQVDFKDIGFQTDLGYTLSYAAWGITGLTSVEKKSSWGVISIPKWIPH